MPHAVFLDEEHFLLQLEFAAQPNPSRDQDRTQTIFRQSGMPSCMT